MEGGRQVAVADGLGWLLGADEGSGFWIGQRVVRAALADLDGRGPATALTPLLLARLGVAAPSGAGDREPILSLVRALYDGPPVRLADHARLVFEVDADGTADRILDDAAAALERTLSAVRLPHPLPVRWCSAAASWDAAVSSSIGSSLSVAPPRSMSWLMGSSGSASSRSAVWGLMSTRPRSCG